MKNIDTAKAYIKDAVIILNESEDSFRDGHYHRTIRKCQEAVELALKGLLRLQGIEYPKSHKIGKVLIGALNNEVDNNFLQRAVNLSDLLADIREPSFYGSNEGLASDLFDREDAEDILKEARFVINFVNDALKMIK
jgi:HEPN domain-containing protein